MFLYKLLIYIHILCYKLNNTMYVILHYFHFVLWLFITYTSTLFYENLSHPLGSLRFETKSEKNLSLRSFVNPSWAKGLKSEKNLRKILDLRPKSQIWDLRPFVNPAPGLYSTSIITCRQHLGHSICNPILLKGDQLLQIFCKLYSGVVP